MSDAVSGPVPTRLTDVSCRLGEGPVWHDGAIWWVDIKAPALYRLAGGRAGGAPARFPLPAPVGAAVPTVRGDWLVALKSGVHRFVPATGAVTPFAVLEPDRPGNRLNDGKVDPAGRFWIGSMDDAERQPSGDFYCLTGSAPAVRRYPAGFVVTNGLGWSGDGRTLYLTDSARRRLYAAPYDPDTGLAGERRLFAEVAPEEGFPDGLCVDADDHVWSCHWDGARISRYRPDGRRDRVIDLPVARPTSCCFGGDALDVLFVTSAQDRAGAGGQLWSLTGIAPRNNPAFASIRGVESVLFAG